MSLLRRLFGPALDKTPSDPVEAAGHVHAPDADPDEVVLPKQKRSSRHLVAGKPPAGWKRQASEESGGVWPWSSGDSSGSNHFGGGGDGGGGGGGGD
jgi:uncharacterized membrane protein YgcG